MYVRQLLSQKYGTRLVDYGGLRVVTTLDLELQEKVQAIVANNIKELNRLKVNNGAAMVVNPQTGEILSMVGSKDYFDEQNDGNVNVALSQRQPGSSIKVINYAAALMSGFTAVSMIEDTPVAFATPGQTPYTPVNYDGRFHGLVTLRSALANSYNIPAVKTLNRIGVKKMVELGRLMGITTWDDDGRFGLALTLGGGEVTLLDMMQVYGILANNGTKTDLDPLIRVSDYTGAIYYDRVPQKKEALIQRFFFV